MQDPLRKILAFGDRLKVKCGPDLSGQGRDYLDRMQSAAARMQMLITDLLTFSRVTTKPRPFVPVDPNEAARREQLSAAARLAYHQAQSGPLREALRKWLEQQTAERLVEPNSRPGKALTSLRGHWETLTRVLTVPGAPLDNNVAERALKLGIRQRKNSLFHATEHSAALPVS